MKWGFKRGIAIAFVLLSAASAIWKSTHPADPEPRAGQETAMVSLGGDDAPARIRFFDSGSKGPVLLLLHGSPVASPALDPLYGELAARYRVIMPDLPGFGRSEPRVADYSIHAHAVYLQALMEQLGIERYHVAGYSMGGGAGIVLADRAPERVESLILVSSIGSQAYELLGDYGLNHAIHGAQLFGLWLADRFLPHFGAMDDWALNYQYARNFYDTDQRPLEAAMERWEKPALIVHGDLDGFVPVEAAREHARLMPQSRLVAYPDSGHLFPIYEPKLVAGPIAAFVDEVSAGKGLVRAKAPAASGAPVALERSGWLLGTGLAVATFVSEDLACIGGGLVASRGAMPLWVAIAGCLLGIFVGDFAIYLMGRFLGARALGWPVVRRLAHPERVERCARWIEKRGMWLLVATRFLPGSRVPTFFAAGAVKAPAPRFAFALFVASVVWTPLIVGLAFVLGGAFMDWFMEREGYALVGLLGAMVAMLAVARLGVALATWRGRRLLYGKWRRLTGWEFWPMWALYPPVFAYLIFKMVRHRSIGAVTAVNPCMPASGLVFESKIDILRHLREHGAPVARFSVVERGMPLEDKLERLKGFQAEGKSSWPVVLKPDVGQRGEGVKIVRSLADAEAYFVGQSEDAILQEYVGGREYGIFYYRFPSRPNGEVLSITDKRLIGVTGDGVATLEELILRDDRAVCSAAFFLSKHEGSLERVVPKGEGVGLADLGTHCRGALFLDGEALITPELRAAVDAMSRDVPGYHFGRYDVRAPSEADLVAGRNLSVIELNGLTSESTNMYDPKHGLLFAWRTLFRQWDLAFRIGKESLARGAKATPLREVAALIGRHLLG